MGRQSWQAESALIPAIIMMESSCKSKVSICKARENALSSVSSRLCLALVRSHLEYRVQFGAPWEEIPTNWNEPRGGTLRWLGAGAPSM